MTSVTPSTRLRRRGWPALALGLVAFAVALAFVLSEERRPARHVTLTAGSQGDTRGLVARALASEVSALGVETEVVDAEGTVNELERVDSGAVDFALVSGAFRIEGYPHVREVAPLYVEALHLLVKQELAGSVGASLTALRGRTVDLGGPGTTSAGLATAVLAFADVRPGGATADGYVALGLRDRELAALLERGDRSALPDAVFHLATVPSLIALRLVRSADYRLVPLPFAEAFRLTALIGEGPTQGPAARIERPYTMDTVVPAFTYQIEYRPGICIRWERGSCSWPTRGSLPRPSGGCSMPSSPPASRGCTGSSWIPRCSASRRGSRCTPARDSSWHTTSLSSRRTASRI
jgi:TRAP-type uncharacterized transport system substrate-binding protein